MELKNAYELSEKQRESMEREFCTMMEEERRNWENVSPTRLDVASRFQAHLTVDDACACFLHLFFVPL